MRLLSAKARLAFALALGMSGCVQAAQTYALVPYGTPSAVGSLSVERIEGGQQLVVLQLEGLPPPERMGPGVREYVVWLNEPHGKRVNVGALRYDRDHRSGNLLATTELRAFTVQVTGERSAAALAPSDVLLAERLVAAK